eukprot:6491147-Prymnesium_polylepis.1
MKGQTCKRDAVVCALAKHNPPARPGERRRNAPLHAALRMSREIIFKAVALAALSGIGSGDAAQHEACGLRNSSRAVQCALVRMAERRSASVVVFGASVSWGVGAQRQGSWPNLLAR